MTDGALRVGEIVRVRGERPDGTVSDGVNYRVGFGAGDTLELAPTLEEAGRDLLWRQP